MLRYILLLLVIQSSLAFEFTTDELMKIETSGDKIILKDNFHKYEFSKDDSKLLTKPTVGQKVTVHASEVLISDIMWILK